MFKIRDIIFIAAATIILPFASVIIIGKLIFHQYFIGLYVNTAVVESVYAMAIGSITGNLLLSLLILGIILRKYYLTKENMGLVFPGWRFVILLPLLMVPVFFLFNIISDFILKKTLNLNTPVQPIAGIVQSIKSWPEAIVLFMAVIIIGPIAEEIIFRLFFYNVFKEYMNIGWSIILSSLLFGMYHLTLESLLPLFLMGLVLAYIYERTKSIIPCTVAHILNNFLSFAILYFSVRK